MFSKFKIPVKLGVLGFLFLVMMGLGAFQYFNSSTGGTPVNLFSSVLALLGLIACLLVGRDLQSGVKDALEVVRSAANGHGASVGSRYAGTRGDEIGSLLEQVASMCESHDKVAIAVENISAGDLRGNDIPSGAGQDRMGKALQKLVGSLRDQVGDTRDNAASLALTAKSILDATNEVSGAASKMSDSINTATKAAEEVRETASEAEEKAKSVSDSAGEATSASVASEQQTQLTTDEMNKVQSQLEVIAASVVRLSEQGQALNTILTKVSDIAEQSNALAINASVEAAKSVEHGRGFSAVADEVKSLASESKAATLAIEAILFDVAGTTAGAVMMIEQGAKSAKVSADRSRETSVSIKDLGAKVTEAVESSAQISASVSKQLAGVGQVVGAMTTIKDDGSQIVNSASQVKSAAEKLSELSSKLEKSVGSYQI